MLRLALVLALVCLFVPAAEAQAPYAIAHFYERELAHTSLGDFKGSTESWRGRLLLLRPRQPVGASFVSCIRVSDTARNCFANYSLPEGQIAAQGIIGDRDRYSLVVIGGTGAYIDFHGWVSSATFGTGFSQLVFHLKLLGK